MRVAIDAGPLRPEPAGVGVYVRSLLEAMAGEPGGNELVVIGKRADTPAIPGTIGIDRPASLPYPVWLQLHAVGAAKRAAADLVHYTDGLVPLFGSPATVLTIHDISIITHWRTHVGRRLARIPLAVISPHLADRVIADSRATADELMRVVKLSASRIDVIPLAPRDRPRPAERDVDDTLRRAGLDRGSFILVPGTLEPRKNHLAVLAAFSQLAAAGAIREDISLVLAGGRGWRSSPILAAIRESPVAHRVRWLGYVPDDDLIALMSSAAIVAYVSLYEGFGLPVLEAMSVGAAVVTSNVSSLPEVAGDAAVLVSPTNPKEIAEGLRLALEGVADLRVASIARASTFSWARTAAQTIDVYRRVRVR
jgi:glycosyltransferase involved in cell wall biosynthesis